MAATTMDVPITTNTRNATKVSDTEWPSGLVGRMVPLFIIILSVVVGK